MHDSFNADRILADAKENRVIAHRGQPRFSAKFGPQSVDLRLFGDFLHSRAKQTKQSRGLARAVLGDEIHDLFKVSRHARG